MQKDKVVSSNTDQKTIENRPARYNSISELQVILSLF